VGELNGQQVKLVRLKGEFIWHRHDDADELFLVVRGTLRILKDVPLGIYRSIASAKLRMKRGERASSR
jgi:mannose-6-phosphate isomerase-like protein (cupin superfamily)